MIRYVTQTATALHLTADDSTFVMIRNRDPGRTGQVIVVENFFEELKAKVGN